MIQYDVWWRYFPLGDGKNWKNPNGTDGFGTMIFRAALPVDDPNGQ